MQKSNKARPYLSLHLIILIFGFTGILGRYIDTPPTALTIYRKREVNIETERKPKTRTTEITADEFYVAVLSNEAKVVLAKFKA